KPENDKNSPEKQTWSTMEELLLACAVHRHGTDSWDSVAAEIQKQNSIFRTLTAFDCRHKYCDLKRRFSCELVSPGSTEGEETVDAAEISSVPWLEELRKLRVDELRREVERYDLSISSLQLKVKRLEDEREESLKIEDSDLDKIAETKENHRDSGNTSGAVPVDEPVNSPDPKDNNTGTGSDNTNIDVKIAEPVDEEPNRIDNDEKPVREDSGRGSCESAANSDREDTVREGNDLPEFIESMEESKGEEETKETSDVQSSASLPRKETVEQDQPDNEDQSPTVNMSVPMIACRKRSSLAVRTSASVTEPSKKKTKVASTVDEKPVSEEEEDETSDKDEEPIVSKKMTRARAPSTAKKVGSRNVKTSLNAGLPSKGRSSNDSSEPKKIVQEKKGNNTSGGSKKQSAASFLKRMKGVSSSENVVETVKADSANGKRGAEQRKSISKNEKVDAAKLSAGQKRLIGKKPTIEKGSPAKKTTGVASKRSSPLIAKRDSETSEMETGSSTRPKKRSRR
ncbi:PREDICTED: neurofilament medium polypeptide-like, partial [Camelina sativa]|uniref:Neurofilament medium polypeptide-like n=1 Tax=Camelina sativa TaxID=90675 RepID=A0ABM0YXL1_CAMSA